MFWMGVLVGAVVTVLALVVAVLGFFGVLGGESR